MFGGGGNGTVGEGDLVGPLVLLMASLGLSSFLTPGPVGVTMELLALFPDTC